MIFDKLLEQNKVPTLFIGSGISRRYLKNYPNWYELLKKIAEKLGMNSLKFNTLKNKIKNENPLFTNTQINARLADEFSDKLSNYILEGNEIIEKIFTKEELSKLGQYLTADTFKYLVCKEFEEYEINDDKLDEIKLFKTASKKIGSVITTNYDQFLEKVIFTDFTVNFLQHQLYFTNSYEYETIYKVHGTVTRPDEIVINSNDYNNIKNNRRLFIAKIYELLLNGPMIFLGYSMNDDDILEILSSFTDCFDSAMLNVISKNIILVEYLPNEKNLIETTETIKCGTKLIQMTVIKTDNYKLIYEYINKFEYSCSVSEINKFRKIIKKLLIDNENGLDKIKVVGADSILKLDSKKIAVAIGNETIMNTIQLEGIVGLDVKEIIIKVLFKEKIDATAIVEKWSQKNIQKTMNFPCFYFSKEYGKDFSNFEKFKNNYNNMKDKFDKKVVSFNNISMNYQKDDIDKLYELSELNANDVKFIYYLVINKFISKEDLRNILCNIYGKNNNEMTTSFKELVCFIDYDFK